MAVVAQDLYLFLALEALETRLSRLPLKAITAEAEYLMMQLTEKVEVVAVQVRQVLMELLQALALVVLEQHLLLQAQA